MPSQDSVPKAFHLPSFKGLDSYEITLDQLQDAFCRGLLTSTDYTSICISRVQQINCYLEAVIEINPDAVAIAQNLDNERRSGRTRGRLHGVPVLVKDNMATQDQMQTTAGSWALLGSVVPSDAHIVHLLRTAGAVILGHANMTEWNALRSKVYSSGYSARGGQTRNPFDLSRSPFGSSSGSAVVVSANIVPLAFGTETDSSIIGPALFNGVVGIKPTVGLTSRSGIVPISESMDTVGPFSRIVADATYALNAIVGPDKKDPYTLGEARPRVDDYSQFVSSRTTLRGTKFGLPWKRCWEHVPLDQKRVVTRLFEEIRRYGGEIFRVDFPCAAERIREDGRWDWEHGVEDQSEYTVVKVEAYKGINSYLSGLCETPVRSLDDVIESNERNSGTEGAEPGDHPGFPSGQDNFREIAKGRGLKGRAYENALSYIRQKSRQEGIDAALHPELGEQGEAIELDALIMCDKLGVGQQMAAQAGYPILSLPIGLDDERLPVGICLLQTAWKEAALIKLASAIEDLRNCELGWRPTPEYRNCLSKIVPIID